MKHVNVMQIAVVVVLICIADRKEGEGPKGGGLDAVATWPLFLIDWAIFFGATLDFVLSESGVALFLFESGNFFDFTQEHFNIPVRFFI